MDSTVVRLANQKDLRYLREMPPYFRGHVSFPFKEDILVAERNGKVLGAVSVGHKDITYVSRQLKDISECPQDTEIQKTSGAWISKFYVFPEHRQKGIAKRLLEESIKNLSQKTFDKAYVGVYAKNRFRRVSKRLFKKYGFQEMGSCICLLPKGYCKGRLLMKPLRPIQTLDKVMKYPPEKLANEITTLSLNAGAELVGFASAEKLEKGAPEGHKPSDLMLNAKSVIILACGRKLNEERDYSYKWGPDFSSTFIKLKEEVKQRRIEARECIEEVKNFLAKKQFKIAVEPHGWSGILSFKRAAHLAGLGVFGKGSFLVHPDLGPLNILACILTDAPLKYGTPLRTDVCKDCTECIKACKYGAYHKVGKKYKWIRGKCRAYDLIMNPVTLKWTYGPCNSKCVNLCPIGKAP